MATVGAKEAPPFDSIGIQSDVAKLKQKNRGLAENHGLLVQSNQIIEYLMVLTQTVASVIMGWLILTGTLMETDPVLAKGLLVACVGLIGGSGIEGTLLGLHRNRKVGARGQGTETVPLSVGVPSDEKGTWTLKGADISGDNLLLGSSDGSLPPSGFDSAV